MTTIKQRLKALEKKIPVKRIGEKYHIIGTILKATDDPQLIGTHEEKQNTVTFYAATLKDAFVLRERYLSDKTNCIALVAPATDNAGRVIDVLNEKHGCEL